MAKLPISEELIIEQFGPHSKHVPPGGWDQTDSQPDRRVKTHCCFCGQQCGIILKVKDNAIIGFDPWEAFPFNKGKLCPKGVKRYMQGSHPDRLLHPLENRRGKGYEPVSWEAAYSRVTSEIERIQSQYGKDSFAMLSGVSLSNEKSYLVGKFARVALQTANLDYNGRLCMVSAGAGNKKAFGIDRAANSWADILETDVILCAGTNVSECAPITTDYIWKARDTRGAKLIVVDPRITPIARTADLILPVRPGTDSFLFNTLLNLMIQAGDIDQAFIDAHTVGFEEVKKTVAGYTVDECEKVTGVPAQSIKTAALWWGKAKRSFLLHARGIEHHTKGVDNVLSCINMVLATGRIGKVGCGYATITGQGNGQGGREHGHKCDQLPGNRDITNPEHRQYISKVWGIDEKDLPGKGLSAQEIMNEIHAGKIRGLLSICFNPLVSLPDSGFTREALEKLEFYANIDFFMSETARYADVILPGSLHEEDEGTSTSAEGRVIRLQKSVNPPAEAKVDWEILLEIARRLGKEKYFDFKDSESMFEELRVASKGGTADYYGITYDRIEKEMGVFWPCPEIGHPGTPRLFEGGKFYYPDGKARFNVVTYKPSADAINEEYPIYLTTGRVIYHYLSGTQTRRIGFLNDQCPKPYLEIHPLLAEKYGIAEGDLVKITSRRDSVQLKARVVKTIRPDTVFVPYHWAGKQSINRLTQRALDPVSKIPEFKMSAVRIEKVVEKNL
ncbi:MAG: molybdopterin oxidoreductase family protein [Candidatus Omnitrophica bacterium]|nr:molybdopterin oxidoreductase family protein [Candidatus Omnitrophota bacterium]